MQANDTTAQTSIVGDIPYRKKIQVSSKVAALGWIVCLLGAMFYCYEYFLRITPSVMSTKLMSAYHINAFVLGNLSAFYYYAYTPMQLAVGVLMDRYGPRRLLTVAILSCAIGSYLFAASTNIVVAEIGRFFVGFGSAFAFVGVLKLATLWLPKERFAMFSGVALTLGLLGAVIGDNALSRLVSHEGWRQTVTFSAAIGIVLALVVLFVVRDKGPYHNNTNTESTNFKSILMGLFQLLKNPQMWINGIIGCLLYMPFSAFAEMWGAPFLENTHHLSSISASTAISLVFIGGAFGGPIAGWFSDKIHKRRLPIVLGGTVTAVLFFILIYGTSLPMSIIYGLLIAIGFFSSAQVLVFAIGLENSTSKLAATAIATTNMFVMLGGAVFQPVIGKILENGWSGATNHGIQLYAISDYQHSALVFPIAIIIAVALTVLLKETHGKRQKQFKKAN